MCLFELDFVCPLLLLFVYISISGLGCTSIPVAGRKILLSVLLLCDRRGWLSPVVVMREAADFIVVFDTYECVVA